MQADEKLHVITKISIGLVVETTHFKLSFKIIYNISYQRTLLENHNFLYSENLEAFSIGGQIVLFQSSTLNGWTENNPLLLNRS